jgi:hypothetical protein
VGGDAEDVDPPGRNLHDGQHVQPPQCDGVDVEEVGCREPARLGAQERPPVGVQLARGGADPRAGERAAGGAGADPMAEADEFALDAPVSPAGILPGQAQNQVTDLVADPWPSLLVRIDPMSANQPAVPGQQGRRGDDPVSPQCSWQCPGQRGQHCSLRPGQLRPVNTGRKADRTASFTVTA